MCVLFQRAVPHPESVCGEAKVPDADGVVMRNDQIMLDDATSKALPRCQ